VNLRSLGYRTDAFITGFDGEVVTRDRYTVVRTPSNPQFRWGNYLIYPDPPRAEDVPLWTQDFAREIPGTPHVLLGWDRPDGAAGAVDAFVAEGFTVDRTVVLTASAVVRPPRWAADVAVRPLVEAADWRGAAQVIVQAFAPIRYGSLEDLEAFADKQIARYRAMAERGFGTWYGAWVSGALAGTLGLVFLDDVGRFQTVATDPAFGRRGVCSTLVHAAASAGLTRARTLVMAADASYHAARVYESVGFTPAEHLVAVLR